ncbi:DUF4150 domain-containing protein [Rhizobiales bacterium RZME27]|uniref:DUF4150 domain-containing protein n=1 Tax=Endobacterium cereale TaxID=2663029 RepID=A0A6A8AE65_9HYPH|nr:PAAR-like domain-containing protein [Endobacterium cereale]MQY49603.1 DUF4150 domain-containing protein [Endobacterium cereale]
MSDKTSGRRDGVNIMVTTGPDVCWTPIGDKMVPVAYTCVAFLDPSKRLSDDVRNNKRLDFQLNTRSRKITGHEPGTGKGVVVPGHLKYSHVKTASSSVFANGWAVVRDKDPAWMNHADIGPIEPQRALETLIVKSVWDD